MKKLPELFESNRQWAEKVEQESPGFFETLSRQQAPKYLWIGCADSRVPANQIVGLQPGEVFVHRNVANIVVHSDFNCLSVLQFAVDVLKVEHVIVVGHYGCGGVRAVLDNHELGLADNWLGHVRDVHERHRSALAGNSRSPTNAMTGCANLERSRAGAECLPVHGDAGGVETGTGSHRARVDLRHQRWPYSRS